jgi:hypothetical protein
MRSFHRRATRYLPCGRAVLPSSLPGFPPTGGYLPIPGSLQRLRPGNRSRRLIISLPISSAWNSATGWRSFIRNTICW